MLCLIRIIIQMHDYLLRSVILCAYARTVLSPCLLLRGSPLIHYSTRHRPLSLLQLLGDHFLAHNGIFDNLGCCLVEVSLLEESLELLLIRRVLCICNNQGEGEFCHITLRRQEGWLGWWLAARGVTLARGSKLILI